MKEALLGGTLDVSPRSESEEARVHVARWARFESKEDRRVPAVRRARSSMSGPRRRTRTACAARRAGGHVGLAGARRDRVDERRAVRPRPPRGARLGGVDRRRDQGQGLTPLACKTDKIDARVLATLSARDLVGEIWLPDPSIRRERELARYRLHLVRHRTTLKNRNPRRSGGLRAPVPGVRSVRARRPRAARPHGAPGSVAGQHRLAPDGSFWTCTAGRALRSHRVPANPTGR